MPVFIASDKEFSEKFEAKNLPIVGDDIKSQIGATVIHRTLAKLFRDRGVRLERTYQLNTGKYFNNGVISNFSTHESIKCD